MMVVMMVVMAMPAAPPAMMVMMIGELHLALRLPFACLGAHRFVLAQQSDRVRNRLQQIFIGFDSHDFG